MRRSLSWYAWLLPRLRPARPAARPRTGPLANAQSPDVVLEDALRDSSDAAQVRADDAVVRAAAGETTSLPADSDATLLHWTSASGRRQLAAVRFAPFSVDVYSEGKHVVAVNSQGNFYFEHRRVQNEAAAEAASAALGSGGSAGSGRRILDWGEDGKPIYADGDDDAASAEAAPAEGQGDASGTQLLSNSESEEGMGAESFGGHTDNRPHGPTSVGVDTAFPGSTHVYGIPEHADTLALRATAPGSSEAGAHSEPYRLYNLDVFEYELHNPMALYGSIPVMIAHGQGRTAGVFWNNPSETFVDVAKASPGASARWMSESGVFDLTVMPGPSAREVFRQYTAMTGTQAMPPRFALGYHQCRWNYKDEADVAAVDAKFEEHSFPYDVLWLDIEHTDGKRYFSWDKALFPEPAAMQNRLAERGRKMVTIVDPHIKRDSSWRIHTEATDKGLYIKSKDGGDFEGWCWPGSSSYLDFTAPHVRDWWAQQFSLQNYQGSTGSLYTWNDMNEPSVFNGPEVSMHKESKSLGGVEHREWHNLYGLYQQMATARGQELRVADGNTRPFVLSRAFFAGSQRYGAIWTGDNAAHWDHLRIAAPMLMSISLSGLSFAGADVGGFFENPDTELMIRWYQAGAFQPFFRAHAHIDTKRREPWLFGDEVLANLRSTVRTRYALLPFWYTQFYHTHASGEPVIAPLWVDYPTDETTFAMETQWLIGSDLMVRPVVDAGATTADVYFPGTEQWLDVASMERLAPGRATVAAPLDKIPVYQRAGSVVPRQVRPRRCSALMANDPFTLTVFLDSAGKASGDLYLDDGISYDFQRSKSFRLRRFDFEGRVLKSSLAAGSKAFAVANSIERIVVVGLGAAPAKAFATNQDGAETEVDFAYDASKDVVTVRKPGVKAAYDFSVRFE